MNEAVQELLAVPTIRASAILLGSILVAFVVELFFRGVVQLVVRKTATELDDQIVAVLRRPVFVTVLLVGLNSAFTALEVSANLDAIVHALLETAAVVLWTGAAFRLSSLVLRHFSERAGAGAFLQPRTMPLFDMSAKLVILANAVYFTLLAWEIDVTGWLASAGIIGVAVGFAAKDSLANLLAGIFILADGPYKIGDVIKFDDGLRGRVTDIGLRSTRILTRDNVEINVPNAVIGQSRVVNESAGPHEKERVPIVVSVAHGSDIDLVRAVLLECTKGQPYICEDPAPAVLFYSFGGAGLNFWLLVWIPEPGLLEEATDTLNSRVYRALREAGVEIPYTKHDVYIRGLPEPAALPVGPESQALTHARPRLAAPEPARLTNP